MTELSSNAANAAAQQGHGCTDCNQTSRVAYLLFWLRYPVPGENKRARLAGPTGRSGHSAHLADLKVYLADCTPKDLWGEDITVTDPVKRFEAIQKAHEKKAAKRDFLVGTPERAGTTTVFQKVFCLNYDLNAAGDITPANREWVIPTWLEVVPRPKGAEDGMWMYASSQSAAYGRYPRLRVFKGWGTSKRDTTVRIHSGREIRHRNTPQSPVPAHLSVDRKGIFTELRGTHGCIRFSLWDQHELFNFMRVWSCMDFQITPDAGTVEQAILQGYERHCTGRAKFRSVEHFGLVAFLYAEPKEDWCAAREDATLVQRFAQVARNMARYKEAGAAAPHICDTVAWSDEDYLEFYRLVPDMPADMSAGRRARSQ